MNLISIENLYKTHGDRDILKNASFSINDSDKIGLIGINGTGKTTLLNIIVGIDIPDKMDIMKKNGLTVEYLTQKLDMEPENTVLQQIFTSTNPVVKLIGEYETLLHQLENTPDDVSLQTKIHDLNLEMDAQNAWQLESEAKAILNKLGIKNYNAKIKTLSGGQKKRVALAGALIRPCDLLILDEPTNHIDNVTIEYLEQILKSRKSALLMVTHDRYFLDRVTTHIVELENATLYKYQGGYSKYLELKEQRLYDEQRIEEKKQALYKQELEWMRKGVEARRTKAKYRKEAFYKLEESLNNNSSDQMNIDVAGSRLGSKILEFSNLSKTYNNKTLFQTDEYTLQKTDRIGIVGKNGLGKTTLLSILAGAIPSDTGNIDWGSTVKLGYFTQEENPYLDPENTALPDQKIIDYIKDGAHFIEKSDGTKISAEKMLELFLFPSHTQYKLISKLSGGERRRLYLLRILMNAPNVLLLDEPTNDLDIETLTVLEEYINEFNGPVITVSHDRYFLDKICNKIFAFTKNSSDNPVSKIEYTVGNYSDYLDKIEFEEEEKQEKEPEEKTVRKKSAKLKLTYAQQKQWETIEDEITELEEKISNLETELSKNSSDFVYLTKLTKEKEELEHNLEEKMNIWEELSELVEKINNQ